MRAKIRFYVLMLKLSHSIEEVVRQWTVFWLTRYWDLKEKQVEQRKLKKSYERRIA